MCNQKPVYIGCREARLWWSACSTTDVLIKAVVYIFSTDLGQTFYFLDSTLILFQKEIRTFGRLWWSNEFGLNQQPSYQNELPISCEWSWTVSTWNIYILPTPSAFEKRSNCHSKGDIQGGLRQNNGSEFFERKLSLKISPTRNQKNRTVRKIEIWRKSSQLAKRAVAETRTTLYQRRSVNGKHYMENILPVMWLAISSRAETIHQILPLFFPGAIWPKWLQTPPSSEWTPSIP